MHTRIHIHTHTQISNLVTHASVRGGKCAKEVVGGGFIQGKKLVEGGGERGTARGASPEGVDARHVTYLGSDAENTSTDPEDEDEDDGEECFFQADATREEVRGCGGGREGNWSVGGGRARIDLKAVPYVCFFTRRDCL